MIAILALWAAGWAVAAGSAGAKPAPVTAKAFDDYVAKAEERIRKEESSVATFNDVRNQDEGALACGKVVVEPRGTASDSSIEVPEGMIHDWSGTIFLPGVTVDDVLAVVQDYDHAAQYYAPEVLASKLVARDGDNFRILLRLREHKVITVVMDSEYDVRYGRLDAGRQFSWSRSTRMAEIADAGGSHEHAVSDADNHGYMWRLNSYWRFSQVSDGVVVQCEAISLTRNVPAGLGWLIGPFVREIPRESLETTLKQTRDAVPPKEHGFWLQPRALEKPTTNAKER